MDLGRDCRLLDALRITRPSALHSAPILRQHRPSRLVLHRRCRQRPAVRTCDNCREALAGCWKRPCRQRTLRDNFGWPRVGCTMTDRCWRLPSLNQPRLLPCCCGTASAGTRHLVMTEDEAHQQASRARYRLAALFFRGYQTVLEMAANYGYSKSTTRLA